jgi:hypothetical protein
LQNEPFEDQKQVGEIVGNSRSMQDMRNRNKTVVAYLLQVLLPLAASGFICRRWRNSKK